MPLVLWRFRITDPITRKKYITRYHLAEEDALKRYGSDAEKIEYSRMEPRDFGSASGLLRGHAAAEKKQEG